MLQLAALSGPIGRWAVTSDSVIRYEFALIQRSTLQSRAKSRHETCCTRPSDSSQPSEPDPSGSRMPSGFDSHSRAAAGHFGSGRNAAQHRSSAVHWVVSLMTIPITGWVASAATPACLGGSVTALPRIGQRWSMARLICSAMALRTLRGLKIRFLYCFCVYGTPLMSQL